MAPRAKIPLPGARAGGSIDRTNSGPVMLDAKNRAAFEAALKDETDPAVRRWAKRLLRADRPPRPPKRKRKRKRAA